MNREERLLELINTVNNKADLLMEMSDDINKSIDIINKKINLIIEATI